MTQKFLGEFEQFVLLAVHKLADNAYGQAIRALLHEQIQRDVTLGALYSTLERMEKKGLVTSQLGDATAQRGGRPKRFFALTADAIEALHHVKQAQDTMWKDVALLREGGCHV